MLRESLDNKIWGPVEDWPKSPWDLTDEDSNQDGLQPPRNPDRVQYPRSWIWESTYLTKPVVGVPVDEDSLEATDIGIHFRWPSFDDRHWDSRCTMTVKRITRIQNQELWTRYYRKKQEMAQMCEHGQVEEKRLFHGTAAENIDSICTDGFQIDRPVVHGRFSGKGHYFTPDLWDADSYAGEGTTGEAPQVFGVTPVYGTSSQPRRRSRLVGQQHWEAVGPLWEAVRRLWEAVRQLWEALDALHAALQPGVGQSRDEPRRHYVLLSKVLTGRSLRMNAPNENPKVATSDFYDSSYHTLQNGQRLHYAVYKDSQAYPEYVIEYVKVEPRTSMIW